MGNLINVDPNSSNAWEKYLANYLNKHLGDKINELCSDIANLKNDRDQLAENMHNNNVRLGEFGADIDNLKVEKEQIANNVRRNNEMLNQFEQSGRIAEIRSADKCTLFNKVTNSQAGEDSIIAYVLAVIGKPLGESTYIDLGANHPIEMSNTYFFYTMGARGVLVEANDDLCDELKKERPEDIVLNNAVSEKSGDTVSFNILNFDGLSTVGSIDELKSENSDVKIEKTVSVETICYNDIVDKYLKSAPVILNLDIEGKEMDILRSIDFENKRPFFIIIEMIPYSKKLVVGQKNEEIMEFMKGVDYSEYAFTGINSIFIDNKALKEINEKR